MGVFDYSKVIVRTPFKFVGVNTKLKFQPLIERMISLAKTKRKGGGKGDLWPHLFVKWR